LAKLALHQLVASDISLKLRQPEVRPALREVCELAAWMAMPETSMHKQHLSLRRENDIRPARQILPMEPVTITEGVEQFSDGKLW
jgi:hypothetical protein